MPKIIKLSQEEVKLNTTENTNGKFDRLDSQKTIKLENPEKNGSISLKYLSNKPCININDNHNETLISSNSIQTKIGQFEKLFIDDEKVLTQNYINSLENKIKILEQKINKMEQSKNISLFQLDEEPALTLTLIEFKPAQIGKHAIFTLNDNINHLYLCYKLDSEVSYWRLLSSNI
jgi:hypothetical protein